MDGKAKIRIVFVDDDPMLLASTRRQLARSLQECEVGYFSQAREALDDMFVHPADIVVSDVRMPGMDGAEFLEKVAQVSPETIRFAWTGQSEGEQLERVFGIAHQVFSKPCPTESLRRMLSRVASFCAESRDAKALDLAAINDLLTSFSATFVPR